MGRSVRKGPARAVRRVSRGRAGRAGPASGDGPRTVARCADGRGPLGSLPEEPFPWRRPGVRAVVIREFGPPEVLEPSEVDEVRAGPDEVVIDVEFANVTFVETQVRAGKPPHPSMLPALPAILGNGVGGTVAETGDGPRPGTEPRAGPRPTPRPGPLRRVPGWPGGGSWPA